jgi:hypothetical protein
MPASGLSARPSIEELDAMYRAGQVGECLAAVHALMRSPEESERITGALFVLSANFYGEFARSLAILEPVFVALQNDFSICHLIALAAWIIHEPALCARASQRCLRLDPRRIEGYQRLGMLRLEQRQFAEAFTILSDGVRHCPEAAAGLQSWRRLAEQRMRGIDSVQLTFDDVEFTFELATFNGHAMEASACFLSGQLCEPEELRFGRQFVGRCDTYVEVGSSVGNHAVYFGKTLGPRNLFIFDANGDAVEQTRRNLARNGLNRAGVTLAVRQAMVGLRANHPEPLAPAFAAVQLDEEITAQVDFLKIDVDGMELEVLEGCRAIIARDRPKIMIEVSESLREPFLALMDEYCYAVVKEIGRCDDTNFFVAPA